MLGKLILFVDIFDFVVRWHRPMLHGVVPSTSTWPHSKLQ